MRFFVEFDVFDALDEFFSHCNISRTKYPLELENGEWNSFRDRSVNFVKRNTTILNLHSKEQRSFIYDFYISKDHQSR